MTFNSRKVNDVYQGTSIISNFWDGEFARLSSNYQNSAPKSTNRFVGVTRRTCEERIRRVRDTSSCLRAAKSLNLRLNSQTVSMDRSSSGLKDVCSPPHKKAHTLQQSHERDSQANFRSNMICMYKSSETFTPRLSMGKGLNSVKIVAQVTTWILFRDGNKVGEPIGTDWDMSLLGTCGNIEFKLYRV